MEYEPKLVMQTEAYLWNGREQLAGTLLVKINKLAFKVHGFLNSHLKLEIRLEDIEHMETFLIYGRARNGLSIETIEGNCTLFVIPELTPLLDCLKKLLPS